MLCMRLPAREDKARSMALENIQQKRAQRPEDKAHEKEDGTIGQMEIIERLTSLSFASEFITCEHLPAAVLGRKSLFPSL